MKFAKGKKSKAGLSYHTNNNQLSKKEAEEY